jgi:hypothetical protein
MRISKGLSCNKMWIRTSLDSAAIPNTRFSFAIDFLSTTVSGLETYCSYSDKNLGRWSTGNSGAHSWKKMLIIWSDTRRGGALNDMMRFGWFDVDGLEPVPKNALELTSEHDLPVSCALCLNASASCQHVMIMLYMETFPYQQESFRSHCLRSMHLGSRRQVAVMTAAP